MGVRKFRIWGCLGHLPKDIRVTYVPSCQILRRSVPQSPRFFLFALFPCGAGSISCPVLRPPNGPIARFQVKKTFRLCHILAGSSWIMCMYCRILKHPQIGYPAACLCQLADRGRQSSCPNNADSFHAT